MPRVAIENIGPIEHAQFDLVPGVTVIEGAPGVGKSTALETINFVVNGQKSSRITKRDGASRGLAEVDGNPQSLRRPVHRALAGPGEVVVLFHSFRSK